MKIRVWGTENECKQAQRFYNMLTQDEDVRFCTVSRLYPNRGSVNQYRVYIEIEYKSDANAYGKLLQSP